MCVCLSLSLSLSLIHSLTHYIYETWCYTLYILFYCFVYRVIWLPPGSALPLGWFQLSLELYLSIYMILLKLNIASKSICGGGGGGGGQSGGRSVTIQIQK